MILKQDIRYAIKDGMSHEEIINHFGKTNDLREVDRLYDEVINEINSSDYLIDAEPVFWLSKAQKSKINPYKIIEMLYMVDEGRKHFENLVDREIYIYNAIEEGATSQLNRLMGYCINSNYKFLLSSTDDSLIISNPEIFSPEGFLFKAAHNRLQNKDAYGTVLDKLRLNKAELRNFVDYIKSRINGGDKTCQDVFKNIQGNYPYRPLFSLCDLNVCVVAIEIKLLAQVKRRGINIMNDARILLEVCKEILEIGR